MRSHAQFERQARGIWMLLHGYSTYEVAEACDVALKTVESWEQHSLPPPEPIILSPLVLGMTQAWDSDDIEAMKRNEQRRARRA